MKSTSGNTSSECDRELRLVQVIEDVARRRASGESVTDDSVIDAHSELMPELGEQLRGLYKVEDAERRAKSAGASASASTERDQTPGDLHLTIPSDSFPGCEIIEEVSRGGQGVVYCAKHHPTGRQVAIKVMREGRFAGSRGKARFEREVRILAQLKHPNIVTIYDSGRAAGSHYFVMDWIAGQPLDVYFATRDCSVGDTLRLFGKICDAVNAAHLRGIIHRDLKPSNILIDEDGEPKILDFGLAKPEAEELGDPTQQQAMTMTGQFVGSLPWASPEQAEGSPAQIDLRTDVYSLGVILYHMLTRRFPYEVSGNVRDALSNILEVDPLSPSTIRKEIDYEVDTIVLKCLAKEPGYRYQSAGAVSEDVDRYLNGQPILARVPSTMYQLKKLVFRNKAPCAFAATFFVLVTWFGVWMSVLYSRAEEERARATAAESHAEDRRAEAVRQAATAEAVNEFLIKDMLASAKPHVGRGRTVTVGEVLDNASTRVEQAFGERPLLEASIRAAIGQSYVSLGLYGAAGPHLREAEAIRTRQLGGEHLDTLRSRAALVDLFYRRATYSEGVTLAKETLETSHRVLGEEHEVTLEAAFLWARLLWIEGRLTESRNLHERTLETRRRVLGEGHPATLASQNQLGFEGLAQYTDTAGAERLFREALNVSSHTLGEDHPEALKAMANLGYTLMLRRELAEAEVLLSEAVEAHHNVLGRDHPDTLLCTMWMGVLRKEQDRVDEAEMLFREARETGRRLLGDHHVVTREALRMLAFTLLRHGKNIEAEDVFREALEIGGGASLIDQEGTAQSLDGLSLALARMGRYAEAERGHRESLGLPHRPAGPQKRAWTLHCLVQTLAAQGKKEEACPVGEELLELRRQAAEDPTASAYQLNCYARDLLTVYPADLRDPERGLEVALKAFEVSGDEYHYNRYILGLAHEANGDLDGAIEWGRRALAYIPVEVSKELTDYEVALVRFLEKAGDVDGAEQVYRDTLAQRRELFPEGHLDIAESLVRLGETLVRHGKYTEAEHVLRECLVLQRAAYDDAHWQIAETMSILGASVAGQDRSVEAEPLLVEGYSRMIDSPMSHSRQARQALKRVERFYETCGRAGDAAPYQAMLPGSTAGFVQGRD